MYGCLCAHICVSIIIHIFIITCACELLGCVFDKFLFEHKDYQNGFDYCNNYSMIHDRQLDLTDAVIDIFPQQPVALGFVPPVIANCLPINTRACFLLVVTEICALQEIFVNETYVYAIEVFCLCPNNIRTKVVFWGDCACQVIGGVYFSNIDMINSFFVCSFC